MKFFGRTMEVDEFQKFDRSAPEVYSEVAGVWDELHGKARINLVFCGSEPTGSDLIATVDCHSRFSLS